MADGPTKTKVAVLGGGIGGIVTAFWLTSTEELRKRYDVTVYQMGWRLGGKGASGRNAALGDRIEEHGLHIWFGFYDNAFLTMRNCYEELVEKHYRSANCPIRDFDGAFMASPTIGLFEEWKGEWLAHEFDTPGLPAPTTALGRSGPTPSLWHIVSNGIEWAMDAWNALCDAPDVKQRVPGIGDHEFPKLAVHHFVHWSDQFDIDLNQFHAGVTDFLLDKIKGFVPPKVEAEVVREMTDVLGDLVIAPMVAFKNEIWEHVIEDNTDHAGLRLFFTTFDTFLSAVCGVVKENVPANGYLSIDNYELSEFLEKHGAKKFTLELEHSPFLRGWYDAAFAYTYEKGAPVANLAAGTGIHGIFGVIGRYHRHIAFKMQAGMGDTVFSPFYEVLKGRGVRFEFFSQVTSLGLSDDGHRVEKIHMKRQAKVTAGADRYDPLVNVKELPCWPSEPRWEQLDIDPEARSRVDFEHGKNVPRAPAEVLVHGTDFDTVVLAIPAPALTGICTEVSARVPAFRNMLDNCHSTMTQAGQIWTTKELGDLGARFREPAIATSFVEPIDTYCDMSHLLDRENWKAPAPKGVAYFCGVMPDQTSQAKADSAVKKAVFELLRDHGSVLWPKAAIKGGFDWSVLHTPGLAAKASGKDRLATQYLRANFEPTERYVLSIAGSTEHRLAGDALAHPSDERAPGIDNLYLAGDWTRNGINGGCVEAATMSGMLTSRAICGTPEHIANQDLPLAVTRTPATGAPFHEYGGLTSVPGPFACSNATIYAFALEAGEDELAELCRSVLGTDERGRTYTRLGNHVVLTFGSMTVRSLSEEKSPFFDTTYADMGASVEHHAALWLPTEVSHRTSHLRLIDQISMFIPAMWVDNPISLLGGREIYGIAKQWGFPTISGGARPSCSLDVYGGSFGKEAASGRSRLFDLVPHVKGAPEPVTSSPPPRTRVAHDGPLHRLLHGKLALPDMALFAEALGSLVDHRLHQVSARQFRTPKGNGTVGTGVELVEATSTFSHLGMRFLHHPFEFTLHDVASHPLGRTLGLRSQKVHFGVEVTADFTLAAD